MPQSDDPASSSSASPPTALPSGKEVSLFIYPDGSVAHLHDDNFRLTCFGPPSIRRASNVEPNADSTEWEVRLPDSHELIATADRRDEALKQEVTLLNTEILPKQSSAHDPL